jgi:glucose-6-phosphate-specific signal transduction histidine kinase
MIVHDAALDAEPGLVGAAGGAALMMLENARLEADLQATVSDLRASRARLASAADAGRREIERNLHDGAQQRLVALRMRLADAEAQAASDSSLRRSLGELAPTPRRRSTSCAASPMACTRPCSSITVSRPP